MSPDRPETPSPDPFGGDTQHQAASVSTPRELADLKILLVESAASMRRILSKLLLEIGCRQVSEAKDGVSALTRLHNGRFDIVITDMHLPGLSGLELLKAVRADRTLRRIPVLMVSGSAERDQVLAAASAGVNAYLLKPFTAAMLENKISQLFQSL